MKRSATSLSVLMLVSSSLTFGAAAGPPPLSIQAVETYKEDIAPYGPVDRAIVILSDGRRLTLPPFDAKPLAILTGADGAHFLLAEGAGCMMCDERTTLRFYLIDASGLKSSGKKYEYPGKLKDGESNTLVQKTRFFYGRCVNAAGDVAVWFEESVGEDGKWHKVQSLVRLSESGESLARMEPFEGSLTSVLKNVRAHSCKELPGIDGWTEPSNDRAHR